jgi:sulfatase modifying factor 1
MNRKLSHSAPYLAFAATAAGLLCDHDAARAQPRAAPPLQRAARAVAPLVAVAADASTLASPVDAATDAGVAVARACPGGMVLAEGDWCVNVDQKCLRWLDEPTRLQCAEFEPPKCTSRRRHMAVCIDRYEYPNQAGVSPTVMASWYDARRLCRAQGKRLCTETEWTFSCEGPAMSPYPYGIARDRTACRIDYQPSAPDRARLGDPRYDLDESARLYGAMPSGTMPRCVSWAGVHDMTGNVDEWTVNETGQPFDSALKGGWWGPIRGRCRPATTAHNEGFIYYQIGFRCCADPDPPYRSSGSAADGGTDGG